MFDSTFLRVYDTTTGITMGVFFICVAAALVLGAVMALVYCFRTPHTSSFVVTLALLPATVAVVIMLVNGNLGAGVAVAGAFSLVRFRSSERNHGNFPCHGGGTCLRHGLSGLCTGFCGGYVYYESAVCPDQLWRSAERSPLPGASGHSTGGLGLPHGV